LADARPIVLGLVALVAVAVWVLLRDRRRGYAEAEVVRLHRLDLPQRPIGADARVPALRPQRL